MKVLVACEYSGRVRNAFRALGHDAWSCDLLEAEDASPFHIQGDCMEAIKQGWDMLIGHPPCTHLSVSGARHFEEKRADGRQQEAIDFSWLWRIQTYRVSPLKTLYASCLAFGVSLTK